MYLLMTSERSKMDEFSGMTISPKQIYDKVRSLHRRSPKKLEMTVRVVICLDTQILYTYAGFYGTFIILY